MAKNKEKKAKQKKSGQETATGYGNQKLEGPNRPSV